MVGEKTRKKRTMTSWPRASANEAALTTGIAPISPNMATMRSREAAVKVAARSAAAAAAEGEADMSDVLMV
jgi:hypothetical protein